MRTAAEVIRRLSQKPSLDDETRDMTALLVYCFRGIDEGIDESARAWEKRDYWIKAEQFRARWAWAGQAAAKLEDMIRADAWEQMPVLLAGLLPHFAEIKITRFTRVAGLWDGAYRRLLDEAASAGEV
jgi:hypothetical protein